MIITYSTWKRQNNLEDTSENRVNYIEWIILNDENWTKAIELCILLDQLNEVAKELKYRRMIMGDDSFRIKWDSEENE